MRKKPPKAEEIGIRELKSRASEVVRSVKEERAEWVWRAFGLSDRVNDINPLFSPE
jgi:hypothetical protein